MHTFFLSKIGGLYETKKGKKIIGDYIKLIKENKILRKQYDIYSQLEEGVSVVIKENKENAGEYVNEMLSSFDGITKKQLKESNNKLFWFLMNNNVITETENPWGKLKEDTVLREGKEQPEWIYTKSHPMLRCMDYLLYEGRKDLSRFIEVKSKIAENLRLKKQDIKETKTTEQKIQDFNDKYKNKLTVEEMEIIRELINTSSPKGVLVEYQKLITNSINDLIAITEDIELKSKYLQLKEKVLFEDYSDVDKVSKLFEIRELIDEIKNEK
jgi:hypothetical protein